MNELEAMGISCEEILKNYDSYHALEKAGGLIRTDATGTNVNVNEQAVLNVLLAMEKQSLERLTENYVSFFLI
ncbi:hypothetical protein BLA28_30660 [Eisenbergiella tayi]|uniref:MOFRL domain-containing protein n=1 Tax=Eisenbergiella tayi TaxID=1432052 RepID=A0A1E3AW03_9FIRM|nr:hypothetical protein BEH84_00519 [Eisenbergiella tayi]OIZ59850.1 hypothetical protein BLA28_30660 [Eisenbergiella tayi]